MNNYEVDIQKIIEELPINISFGKEYSRFAKLNDINTKTFHAKELTIYDEYEFIINCYKAILKREPDQNGLTHYYDQLKNDKSKISIIKQLMASPEGKAKNIKISGLLLLPVLERVKKNRLFQFFYTLTIRIKRINPFFRIKTVTRLSNEVENMTNEFFNIRSKLENIYQKIEKHDAKIDKLYEEIGINLSDRISGWDELYSQFENQFRGSSELVKERIKIYIPIIEAIKSNEKSVVLDLGCGRGEWLELLQENNLQALGIDANQTTVDQCLKRKLHVIHDDVMNYLQQQPSNTYNAITGFHIIEHLPFITLMNLIDEIYRTLKKDGVLIFETPNPANVTVGSCSFYYDPTHKKPLPPQLMEFILQKKGFSNTKLIELNPATTSSSEQTELGQKFNRLFYGPQDYAVLGYK